MLLIKLYKRQASRQVGRQTEGRMNWGRGWENALLCSYTWPGTYIEWGKRKIHELLHQLKKKLCQKKCLQQALGMGLKGRAVFCFTHRMEDNVWPVNLNRSLHTVIHNTFMQNSVRDLDFSRVYEMCGSTSNDVLDVLDGSSGHLFCTVRAWHLWLALA